MFKRIDSFNKSTENDNSDKITERSITPVKIRTPSTVTKANTPNISIADLRVFPVLILVLTINRTQK